jgi:hypothetical protein
MDGQGTAPQRVLKTRDTERYAGRHGAHPPIGSVAERLKAPPWKGGRPQGLGRSNRPASAKYGELTEQGLGAASKTDGWRKSLWIKTTVHRQFNRDVSDER